MNICILLSLFLLLGFFISAETLIDFSIVSWLILFLKISVYIILMESINLPCFIACNFLGTYVLGIINLTVCNWIFHFQNSTLGRKSENNCSWTHKHNEDDDGHTKLLISPLGLSKIPILPNYIRWLRSFTYLQLLCQEMGEEWGKHTLIDLLIE